jgi:hypothetical protein
MQPLPTEAAALLLCSRECTGPHALPCHLLLLLLLLMVVVLLPLVLLLLLLVQTCFQHPPAVQPDGQEHGCEDLRLQGQACSADQPPCVRLLPGGVRG